MEDLEYEEAFRIMEAAWGEGQDGFVFFPWVRGDAPDKESRTKSWQETIDETFHWPSEKDSILTHFKTHENDDVFWCPNMFSERWRRVESETDEHCLYADLDEIDPREIIDYPPTVAWETSPGRYQALWIFQRGIYYPGASGLGGINQRLSHHVGADKSGWDTTQLLRIPGWPNHKPAYRELYGKSPKGGLVWLRREWRQRRIYQIDDFTDLPEVRGAAEVGDFLESAVNSIDRNEVLAEVELKLSKKTRDQINASHAPEGIRSGILWGIGKDLAKVGCSAPEIVAVLQGTVWNKFEGRPDEFTRLSVGAQRVVLEVAEEPNGKKKQRALKDTRDLVPVRHNKFFANVRPPIYLVDRIFNRGACGYIGATPKTGKSFVSLDLAISVATGTPFLNTFEVPEAGPVLYIGQEDGGVIFKKRWELFGNKVGFDVHPVYFMVHQGFDLGSNEHHQRLAEILEEEVDEGPFALVIFDTFISLATGINTQDPTQITSALNPLKILGTEYDTTMVIDHHANKSSIEGKTGGQRLLGSQAFHAWAEDSLYISELQNERKQNTGIFEFERESKLAPRLTFKVRGLHLKDAWDPKLYDFQDEDDIVAPGEAIIYPGERTSKHRKPRYIKPLSAPVEVLKEQGPMTPSQLSKASGVTISQVGNLVRRGTLIRNPTTHMVELP